ncbi:hypothetical protein C8R45DRAFT_628083 [Mycena sanguinolenta]|nr:hypothetical protein C8R45DRAFT_628083 [Mycena sanguinolenta]
MAAQTQGSATAQAPATLPQFAWDPIYEPFRVSLWPAASADGNPDSAQGEPPALLDRIETLTPDDGWLSSKKSDDDTMDVDDSDDEGEGEDPNDGEDADEEPAGVRYISLKAHPALAFEKLAQEIHWRRDEATFVVRHEYSLFMEHAMSRLNNPPDDSHRARFFVTGQPGIGKSYGCYYLLFRLLAMGQSVFFLRTPTSVYYFSSDGVQHSAAYLRPWPAIVEALRNSWVLVDLDEKTDSSPPYIFNHARCVVWTSSPRGSPMKKFLKTYGAEKWYMKPWSSKEIAAVTERLAINQTKVLARLATGGPVARSLFGGVPVPTPESIENDIKAALRGNIFALDASGEGVFLIQPVVSIDKGSGPASLQRTDYSAEFLSAHIAHTTFDLAQHHLEKIQGQLADALDASTTRSVAGKLLAAMMRRAFARGIQLPAVFGAGTVAGTLKLIGKAGTFVCETAPPDIAKRPLCLRPESPNFAAVDAILATDDKLGLIQVASLGDSHRKYFGMMLRIMSRLPQGAQVDVSRLGEVIYCLVGTDPERVHKLVAEANRTLGELKMFDAEKLGEELSMRHTNIAHKRLSTFRVVGYTFHYKQGFAEVL